MTVKRTSETTIPYTERTVKWSYRDKTLYTANGEMSCYSFRRFSTGQLYYVDQNKSFHDIKSNLSSSLGISSSQLDLVRGPFIVESKEELMLQTEMALIVHPVVRHIVPGFSTTDVDMFEGHMADGPRVRMACGHAVTPDNLFRFCLTKLKDSNTNFTCKVCHQTWNFDEINQKAALSDDERIYFRQRINEIDSMNTYYYQHRDKGATNDLLKNCERVTMGYSNIPNVPKIRACPKCFKFIEFQTGCKTMTCSCSHVFCFSCLKPGSGSSLSCGSYESTCQVAPVQTI